MIYRLAGPAATLSAVVAIPGVVVKVQEAVSDAVEEANVGARNIMRWSFSCLICVLMVIMICLN